MRQTSLRMLDVQERPRISEMQKISGITELEESWTRKARARLRYLSLNHSIANCSWTIRWLTARRPFDVHDDIERYDDIHIVKESTIRFCT